MLAACALTRLLPYCCCSDLRLWHASLASPVSINVVPPTESHKVHLVAVTAAGHRIFFTVHAPTTYGASSDHRSWIPGRIASRLSIYHVRQPPHMSEYVACGRGAWCARRRP